MSIENRFEGIEITQTSLDGLNNETELLVRKYIYLLNIPIAVLKCGTCGEVSKEKLDYPEKPFSIEKKELRCNTCQYQVYISYKNS